MKPKAKYWYDSKEFRDMWLSPMPLREIARRCGVHISAVTAGAARYGLPPKSTVNARLWE